MQILPRVSEGIRRKSIGFAGVVCLAVAVSACSPIYRNHGYVPPAEDLQNVVVGVDTIDSVEETLGSPSGRGVLQDSDIFYTESRWKTFGMRPPKEIHRDVVVVRFDSRGTVSNVVQFGLEQGQVISFNRRVTDSNIADVTFFGQLLGAFGNFDAGQALTGSPSPQ
ncbi:MULTISPECIES: outer membrane protein assembly factor BamE [Halocynthiibacter]|uniref:Outer membrane protein assembly factor BamE n=1 Tax=Halocynthiibacter halioticoli TaxID=2986804 RepID=A0AAE3IY39_9RHOB|nr:MULTISPECIES: outer membrane protein assembly factor BamE [Halocynthiibacter]MCV6824238.1 outer membrane protein assembly factor BamE [Halocynthiibacter halioticoli]MCW4057239.1 outer membrane protein assembly factor BamE [Halocynthiibacter sp. SDUM655004]